MKIPDKSLKMLILREDARQLICARVAHERTMMDGAADSDLLYGVPAIARYLGLRTPQCRSRIDAKIIPTFRIGGTICARKSSLDRWLAEIEAAAGLGTCLADKERGVGDDI